MYNNPIISLFFFSLQLNNFAATIRRMHLKITNKLISQKLTENTKF